MARPKREINHHPNPLKLMFVNEMAAVVGLNAKALRKALHDSDGGLEHVLVGNGFNKTPKSNLYWFQRWLERHEQHAEIDRATRKILREHADESRETEGLATRHWSPNRL